MKNWENRLSALLLLAAGMTLAAILVLNIWIAPPGSGMTLVEPESRPESAAESLPMPELPGPVNLNTATLAELDTLPGVGEVIAERILAYREAHGNFTEIEQLMEVDGIGEKTFAELKDHVTLE